MKDIYISDLAGFDEGKLFDGYFLVLAKQQRTTKTNKPYLNLILGDKTGQIEGRVWEVGDPRIAKEFDRGDIVKVRGCASKFDDRLQMKVDQLRLATFVEVDKIDLLPATTCDVGVLWSQLLASVESIANTDLKRLLTTLLADTEIAAAYREAPAARQLHHAWLGGLLEHVVSLMGVCELAAMHYPEVHRDLLLTGALLHDIGKLHELVWKKSFDYTIEGQLLGHITIGYGMIEKKLETLKDFPPRLRVLVEHMVLSHHGRYEYGSPKLPMIPEAILLHYLDDMDAKMQTVRAEFARAASAGRDGDQMTEWVRALERPLLDTTGYLAGEGAE